MAKRDNTDDTTTTTEDQRTQDAQQAEKDAGADQVQEAVDAAEEQGYYGTTTDPTPRENYTVSGSGQTPETDPELAAKAREARNG